MKHLYNSSQIFSTKHVTCLRSLILASLLVFLGITPGFSDTNFFGFENESLIIEDSNEDAPNLTLCVYNTSDCPITLYHWVSGGDIKLATIHPGGNYCHTSSYNGAMYRASNDIAHYGPFSIYDEHYTVNTKKNDTWHVSNANWCPPSLSCNGGDFQVWTDYWNNRFLSSGPTQYCVDLPSAFLGASSVDIRDVVAWDAYTNRVNVHQACERMKFIFKRNGNVISQSNYTPDLADKRQWASYQGSLGVVNTPGGIDRVCVVHYNDPNNGTGGCASANSLNLAGLCLDIESTCNADNFHPGEINWNVNFCDGGNPSSITSKVDASGCVGGSIEYRWEVKGTGQNASWQPINNSNNKNYDPPYTSSSKWYKRGAKCSPCGDWEYSNVIDIHVSKNYTNPGSLTGGGCICSGDNPGKMVATAPSGGTVTWNGFLQSKWESKVAGGNWTPIAGYTNTDANPNTPDVPLSYTPTNVSQTTQYRRCSRIQPCEEWKCTNVATVNIDDEDPTITQIYNGSTNLQCGQNPPSADQIWSATDNCDNNIPVSNNQVTEDISYDNCGLATIVLTITVEDDCHNSASKSITFKEIDNTDPTASNPSPINVVCWEDVPGPDPSVVTDESDNCSGGGGGVQPPSGCGSIDCNPFQSRTVSNTQGCNGGNPYRFYMNGSRWANVGSTKWYECSNSGRAYFSGTFSLNGDQVEVEIFFSGGTTNPPTGSPKNHSCLNENSNGWKYYPSFCGTVVSNNHGTFSVSRRGEAFQVGNGANVTSHNLGYGGSGWFTVSGGDGFYNNGDINIMLSPTTTDVGGGGNSGLTVEWVSDSKTSVVCNDYANGGFSFTRTYRITDCSGNSTTVTQTINVNDTVDPTASNPSPINAECWDEVPAPNPAVVTDEADNCDAPNTLTVVFVDDSFDPDCDDYDNGFTVIRRYRITDCAGNSTMVQQMIHVDDTTDPTASNPAPISVECFEEVPAPNPAVVTDEDDNCSEPGELLVQHVSDSKTSVSCNDYANGGFSFTRTYRITDCAGNSTTVTQTINVNDTTDPTGGNPATINVECFEDVPAPNTNVVAVKNDNCSAVDDLVIEHVSDSKTSVVCNDYANGGFTFTRTYRITDCAGNSTIVTQTINVDDTTDPSAETPDPINVQCWEDIPNPTASILTGLSDNCTPEDELQVIHMSDSKTSVECNDYANGGFSLIRTFRITDCAGNTSFVQQDINVNDTTDPTASNPAPINVECWEDIPAPNPSVVTDEADNCAASNELTVEHVSDSKTTVACNDYANGGFTFTRTYRITDCAGNSTTVSQTININDTTDPTASNPAPINVECWENVPAPNPSVVTDEADNCAAPNELTVVHVSDSKLNASCNDYANNGFTFTRTYRITDCAGNSITVQQTINVNDTVDPTASNPAPINVECFEDVPAADVSVVTDEADNCDAPNELTVTHIGDSKTTVQCEDYANGGFTFTRTYRITDCAGNYTEVVQTINVDDTTDPMASNPAPIVVECWEEIPSPSRDVVTDESDNCTPANELVVVHMSDSKTSVECDDYANGGFTFTRTYRVTDCAGNFTMVQQTITVDDTTDPTASNPAPINVECWEEVPAPDVTVVTDESDNCDAPNELTVEHVSDSKTSVECDDYANGGFTFTRTYRITDCAGNSIDVQQTINVDDTTDPTASNPASVTVECWEEVPSPDVTVVTDESDNCAAPNTLVVQHVGDSKTAAVCSDYANGGFTIVRTYSITDCAGNSIEVEQTINVNDTTDPTASNPAPINVECFEDVPAPDVTVVIDEADNCDAPNELTVTHEGDSKTTLDCDDYSNGGFTFTRTYRITDCAGNFTEVVQTINVNDTTDPEASDPAPITVECWEEIPAPNREVVIDESDNCTPANELVVVHMSDSKTQVECADYANGGFSFTRTYRITDCAGNFTLVNQTITVDDTTNPEASNPAPINVECWEEVPAPDVTVVTDESDNCDAPNELTVEHVSDSKTSVECDDYANGGFTFTRTYRVTDCAGNSITVEQTINVDDTTNPTASNPAPVSVQCWEEVPAPDVTVVTDEADNCAAPNTLIVNHEGDNKVNAECSDYANGGFTIIRTYSITDCAGNSITVEQTINVDDTTNPTASNPAPVTVECWEDVPAADVSVVTDEADNCDAPNELTVEHVGDSKDDIDCGDYSNGGFTFERTYSITDCAGNSIEVVQTITVNDTTDPTASDPAPINVECWEEIPAPNREVVIDEADNCTPSDELIVVHMSDSKTEVECADYANGGFSFTRTYRVTDCAGNFTLVNQTINVNDTTDPTASNPAAITVQCWEEVPAPDVTVVTDEADNCDSPNELIVAHVSDSKLDAACEDYANGGFTFTRTYSITDCAGNSITVEQIINVDDTTRPTASNPTPITVQCWEEVPAPDVTVVTDEADNCAAPNTLTVAHEGDNKINAECEDYANGGFTIIRTYSITDCAGNSITVDQTITVNDTTDPTASNPAPVTVECWEDVPAADVTVVTDEADNCDAPNELTVEHVGDSKDDIECGDYSNGGFTFERTYSITDCAGNSIEVVQTITVADLTDPTASNPAPVTVECWEEVPAPDVTVVTDEADNCTPSDELIVEHVSDSKLELICSDYANGGFNFTRTYRITDCAGNFTQVTQTITVDDVTDPTASNPAPITVECWEEVPAPDSAVVTDEADNCAAPNELTVIHVSDSKLEASCNDYSNGGFSFTRTYSVTDCAGNSITVEQLITINDTTDPTASNPAPINVECFEQVPAPDVTVVTDEADNCDSPNELTVEHVSDNKLEASCDDYSNGGFSIVRTYSVTDCAGNSITVEQTINVNDTTDPTASNPATINVECWDDVPAPDVTVVTDEADNCDAPNELTVEHVGDSKEDIDCGDYANGGFTFVRTYSVTDCAGNSINVEQTIIVTDTTNPTASTPQAITVECWDEVPAPDVTVVTDEADNCTAENDLIVEHVGDSKLEVSCGDYANGGFTFTRIYRIIDCAGNSTDVTQTINVNDTTDPEASNPSSVTVQCWEEVPSADVSIINDASDNCTSVADLTIEHVGDSKLEATCDDYANGGFSFTRTYRITDCAGNSIEVVQTITVDDTIQPTASSPAPINVECWEQVPAPDVTVVTDEADNCAAPNTLTVEHVGDNKIDATCEDYANGGFTFVRTYRITDCAGNYVEVDQTINVNDTTNPTASNPASVTVECFEDVPAPDVTVVTDESDNCMSPNTLTVEHVGDSKESVDCGDYANGGFSFIRTYRVTDCAGNSITVEQTINIEDNTNPTASNPPLITVECFEDVPAPDVTVVSDEADNCSEDSDITVAHVSDSKLTVECNDYANGGFVFTRIYSVTDCAGNSIEVTQNIKVEDTTNPNAENPAPITVECWEAVPAPDVTVIIGASDNCTAQQDLTYEHVSDSKTSVECEDYANGGFNFERTYRVIDCAGNATIIVQRIYVMDLMDPTASNPEAINVECFDDVPAPDVSVVTDEADNCDAPNELTVEHVADGKLTVACGDYANGGFSFVRTYSVTDCAGNSIEVQQQINVNDTTNPTASNPAQVEVACWDDIPAPNPAVVVDETDNCSDATDLIVAFVSDDKTDEDCSYYGNGPVTVVRTYSITDCAGNQSLVTQNIVVADPPAPMITCPMDEVVDCYDNIAVGDATFSTSCGRNGVVTTDGPNLISGEEGCDGAQYEIIYTVTDECGLSASCAQNWTLNVAPPTITCPQNRSVNCFDEIQVQQAEYTTSCGQTGVVAEVGPILIDGNDMCNGAIYSIEYTVTDECGVSASCEQNWTLIMAGPSITCPDDQVVDCESDLIIGAPVYTTECGQEGSITTSGPTLISGNAGCDNAVYEVEYVVTDECQESAACVQTWTLNVAPPTITCPQDQTVNCLSDISVETPGFTTACSQVGSLSNDGPVLVNGNEGCDGAVYEITYVVTDECQETASCTQSWTLNVALPTISCPESHSVACLEDVVVETPTFTTACSQIGNLTNLGPTLVNGNAGCSGATYSIEYTITDECGESASCTQQWTLIVGGPAIECAADIQVDCAEDISIGTPSYTTECGQNGMLSSEGPTLISGSAGCKDAVYQIVYTVTDDCQETASCSQNFTLLVPAPTITCPFDAVVECESEIEVGTAQYTTSCGLLGIVSNTDPILTAGTAGCDGAIYEITYSVVDECEQTSSCVQTWTLDVSAPSIICPVSLIVECFEDIKADDPIIDIACEQEGDLVVSAPNYISGVEGCDGAVYQLIYTIKDRCGSEASCEQNFTLDLPSPTIGCPENKEVACLNEISPEDPITSTSCGQNGNVSIVDPILVGGTAGCSGAIYEVQYVIEDECGQSASCIQTVTLTGGLTQISCPSDASVICLSDVADSDPLTSIACGVGSSVEKDGPNLVSGQPLCDGSVYQTIYTVVDACGSSASCTQTIILLNLGLQLDNPAPIADISCSDQLPVQQQLTATTPCGVDARVETSIDDYSPDACNGYTVTYRWIASDDCGNTEEKTVSFNVLPCDATADNTTEAEICSGESFEFFGQTYELEGTYEEIVTDANGCEYKEILILTVNPLRPDLIIDAFICEGESYEFYGEFYTEEGEYTEELLDENGCVYFERLGLQIIEKPQTVITTAEICSGEIYTWSVNGLSYSLAGTYTVENDGCTADEQLILTVTDKPQTVVTTAEICSGASYTWSANGLSYTAAGTYNIENDGCSADLQLILTVTDKPQTVVTTAEICSGASYTWSANGLSYSDAGTYTIESDGCTADEQLILILFEDRPDLIIDAIICEGEAYEFYGEFYTEAGEYVQELTDANGCTYREILGLEIQDKPETIVTDATICEGESYTWNANGLVYTAGGNYTYTGQGCDADQELNLTITPKPETVVTQQTICEGESFLWNGLVYTSEQDITLPAATGCDADQRLILTVTPSPQDIVTQITICEGESYQWNGQVYTGAGRFTFPGATLCDANQILELSVTAKPADEVVEISICNGESYLWNGLTYSSPGVYTNAATDPCDADEVLILSLFSNSSDQITTINICEGESYVWYGNDYSQTGFYSEQIADANGCIYMDILNLTVIQNGQDDILNITICQGDSYEWNNQSYTMPGSYTAPGEGVCAGDQILNLTLFEATEDVVLNETICVGEFYTFGGQVYTESGTYTQELGDTNGCIYMYTLNLNVIPDCNDPCLGLTCVITGLQNECESQSNGEATMFVTGGTPPYSFEWSDGQTTSTAVGLSAGTYSVTATDATGCKSDGTIQIVDLPNCLNAGIAITKTTNGIDDDVATPPIIIVDPNSSITVQWDYAVTNTGQVDLTNVQVVDNVEGFICTIPLLAAGETQTCSKVGIAGLGLYSNVGSATGTPVDDNGTSYPPISAQDTSSYIGAFMNVEKQAESTCVCPGEEVEFTLIVRLLGGAPGMDLRNITLTDTYLPNALDTESPEFVKSSDVNGDGMISFIDNNGDGISDEEFIFKYTLTIDQTITNTAMDMGEIFFNDEIIGMSMNSSSVTVTASEACCGDALCDIQVAQVTGNAADCGIANGSVAIDVQGGLAPYQFEWASGQTGSSLDNLLPGAYTVSVTDADNCMTVQTFMVESIDCGRIGNLVWEDLDADGFQDLGENGIPNVQVQLVDAQSNAVIMNTFTDTDGKYAFDNIYPGNYFIRFVEMDGSFTDYIPTFSHNTGDEFDSDLDNSNGAWTTQEFSFEVGEEDMSFDAGFYRGNEIGDQVWIDEGFVDNGFDSDDSPAEGVMVNLYSANSNTLIASTTTDVFGKYSFRGVPAGSYIVEFVSPSNMIFIAPNSMGADDLNDSDAVTDPFNSSIAFSQQITVLSGDSDMTIDAGLVLSSVLAANEVVLSAEHIAKEGSNALTWETELEINTAEFVIERSIGSIDRFQAIGNMEAAGNASAASVYNYQDSELTDLAIHYYRVMLSDLDGKSIYSNIVAVNVESLSALVQEVNLDVYPNPVLNQLNVDLTTSIDAIVEIGIYDAIGQLIKNSEIKSVESGMTNVKLNLQDLPTGTYLLRVKVDDQVFFEKVSKAE